MDAAFLYALPQSYHAAVVELLDCHKQYREQQHPPHAAHAPADVYRRERGDRVKTDLIAEELCLCAAAHEVNECPAYDQADSPPGTAEEQTEHRPRHQHDACAEHRQRVYQRGHGGDAERAAHAKQQERNEQLYEGHRHKYELGAHEAAEAAAQVGSKPLKALAEAGGELREDKGVYLRESCGDEIGADPRRYDEQERIGACLRRAG